jgi:hypothetical protein
MEAAGTDLAAKKAAAQITVFSAGNNCFNSTKQVCVATGTQHSYSLAAHSSEPSAACIVLLVLQCKYFTCNNLHLTHFTTRYSIDCGVCPW